MNEKKGNENEIVIIKDMDMDVMNDDVIVDEKEGNQVLLKIQRNDRNWRQKFLET